MSYQPTPIRVSDADRERAAALLREHWTEGRLDNQELDDRCAEVWAARSDYELNRALRELPAPAPPPPVDTSAATTSLILGVVGLTLFTVSFGFLSVLTLPMSATAWAMGRGARRRGIDHGAKVGMVLGMVGTVVGVLALGGCAAFLL